jgi:hypothetical protein
MKKKTLCHQCTGRVLGFIFVTSLINQLFDKFTLFRLHEKVWMIYGKNLDKTYRK